MQLRAYGNPSLIRQLRGDQRCFRTPLGHCDCGTVLGSGLPRQRGARHPDADRERLRRKGCGEAKIARALLDKQERGERSERAAELVAAQELAAWTALIAEMLDGGVREFGLLLHAYRGPLEEEIALQGVESFAVGEQLDDILLHMRHDMLYLFRAGAR